LFEGLEKAMAADPRIHFLATIPRTGHDEEYAYRRFRALVERSPRAARYHLLSGLDAPRLAAVCRECDLALRVDGMNYETLFGARTPLLNLMAAGLPAAITLGTEFSHLVREENLGHAFPVGDAQALSELLRRCAAQPHALRAMGQKARNYVTRHFAAVDMARPILEWAEEPRLAPDNAEKDRMMAPDASFLETPLNNLQKTQIRLAGVNLEELFQAKIDVDAIRRKRWYRIGSQVKRKTLDFLKNRHILR
jgi:hypothetical protein